MRKFVLLIVTVTLCHCVTSVVFAESLSVSLRVGDTQISFDGYTSPSAFITIKQNSVVVGTTVADTNGNWDKTIVVDNAGIQTFALYALDTNSILTPTLSYNVNVSENALTNISHIVLPPTISADGLTLSGTTHPLSTLTLMISDGTIHSVPVNASGIWSYSVSINTPGSYSAYITATMPGNYISLASNPVTFVVNPSSTTTSTASSASLAQPTILSPSPTPVRTRKITSSDNEGLSPMPTSDAVSVVTQQVNIPQPVKTITIVSLILALLSPIKTFFIFLFNKLRTIPFFTLLFFRKKKDK